MRQTDFIVSLYGAIYCTASGITIDPATEQAPAPDCGEPRPRGPRAHGQDWAHQTHAQKRHALRGHGRKGGKGAVRV